jgi:nucleoside 2-deoxyribosyltransferase
MSDDMTIDSCGRHWVQPTPARRARIAETLLREGGPKVYLAGPISGLNFTGATDWRDHAQDVLARLGIKALSPMRAKDHLKSVEADVGFSATCEEYGHLSPLSCPRGIMTRDRFDATRCDVLLVNLIGASKVSVGTVMEIAWADLKRTPIVVCIEPDGSNPHEHCMISEAIGFRAVSLDEGIDIVAAILS